MMPAALEKNSGVFTEVTVFLRSGVQGDQARGEIPSSKGLGDYFSSSMSGIWPKEIRMGAASMALWAPPR